MKPRPPLPPGPYLVVGAGLSGQAVAAVLDEAILVATDADGMEHLDAVQTVVKSPGIRPSVELIRTARERGLTVAGELEIAWRLLPNEFIAVTGTNGKTTTAALLGQIHARAGIAHQVAGNIGTALSSLVGKVEPDAVVICECSSFQLADSLLFAPECAVLLNLEPDHLDWHDGFQGYRDAKLRIFANQAEGDVAVVAPGFDPIPGGARRIEYQPADPDGVRLRGAHNMQNAGAAAAAARARGVPEQAIGEALAEFAGVPHRLEEIAVAGGVTWVNDSKATNVASTLVALDSFDDRVHLIAGGRGKGEDFGRLHDAVMRHCRAVYLIGETAQELAYDLAGAAEIHECGDLESAVRAARAAAEPGDVVLLSPAAASYDQFKDFEERGERFGGLVHALP